MVLLGFLPARGGGLGFGVPGLRGSVFSGIGSTGFDGGDPQAHKIKILSTS